MSEQKTKVTLPKEVAGSLEYLRDIGMRNADIISESFDGMLENNHKELVMYTIDRFDDFISALVNGYEVEQTPEEQLAEYYAYLSRVHDDDLRFLDSYGHTMTGVKETLRILGITIAGINDKEAK